MNEVRVLVLSPFDYVYGSKEISYWCGDFFYLNPSSSEEHLEELKFILDSSYLLKGWIYLEDSIKLDYKNKTGVFTPQISISSEPKEESSSSLSEPEIKIEEVKEISEIKIKKIKKLEENKEIQKEELSKDVVSSQSKLPKKSLLKLDIGTVELGLDGITKYSVQLNKVGRKYWKKV